MSWSLFKNDKNYNLRFVVIFNFYCAISVMY